MVLRMAHKIAKLILEHANSFLERTEAIDAALSLGMTLNEIQEYLDWIDSLPEGKANKSSKSTAKRAQEGNSAMPDGRLSMENGEGEPSSTSNR